MTWTPVTRERFDEMLGVLPPEIMTGNGFLVGEPMDHNNGRPRFSAFVEIDDQCYEASEPMTVKEFKALTHTAVLTNLAVRLPIALRDDPLTVEEAQEIRRILDEPSYPVHAGKKVEEK